MVIFHHIFHIMFRLWFNHVSVCVEGGRERETEQGRVVKEERDRVSEESLWSVWGKIRQNQAKSTQRCLPILLLLWYWKSPLSEYFCYKVMCWCMWLCIGVFVWRNRPPWPCSEVTVHIVTYDVVKKLRVSCLHFASREWLSVGFSVSVWLSLCLNCLCVCPEVCPYVCVERERPVGSEVSKCLGHMWSWEISTGFSQVILMAHCVCLCVTVCFSICV